jgi:hypothetical protein
VSGDAAKDEMFRLERCVALSYDYLTVPHERTVAYAVAIHSDTHMQSARAGLVAVWK